MTLPIAIDLFCGLGGWSEGCIAEGYAVTGFDIESHEYGDQKYPGTLVIQDVATLHGAQFKDAALIVASPPCQEYSYMAMPWSIAKAKQADILADTTGEKLAALNRLFDTCFRIQREACEAAGHHIPMVVENVRGAQKWVGRARWNFGSFYFWGDVPALMPHAIRAIKAPGLGAGWVHPSDPRHKPGLDFTRLAGEHAIKVASAEGRRTDVGKGARFTSRDCGIEAEPVAADLCTNIGGDWFAEARKGGSGGTSASFGSKSPQRKAASALIAKIPLTISRHIAATYHPSRNAK